MKKMLFTLILCNLTHNILASQGYGWQTWRDKIADYWTGAIAPVVTPAAQKASEYVQSIDKRYLAAAALAGVGFAGLWYLNRNKNNTEQQEGETAAQKKLKEQEAEAALAKNLGILVKNLMDSTPTYFTTSSPQNPQELQNTVWGNQIFQKALAMNDGDQDQLRGSYSATRYVLKVTKEHGDVTFTLDLFNGSQPYTVHPEATWQADRQKWELRPLGQED